MMTSIYTCPMHPEIQQEKPGECPICGMTLELKTPKIESENSELKTMQKRFYVALFFTIPLLILEALYMVREDWLTSFISPRMIGWIEALLATPVVLWAGSFFFKRGFRSFNNLKLNMFTLISLGVGAAYLYSLAAVFFPGIFPYSFQQDGKIGIYFEAATVITVLVILGQVLELRARAKTGDAIRALLDLSPKMASIEMEGVEKKIPLSEVKKGDHLRVRPGEKVPVDGVIFEGASTIDESMITGESMPIDKEKGSSVTGGTLNQNGSFLMIATKVGDETLLARIIRMVSEAQSSKAPIQNLADQVAGYFVPIVIVVAILTFIGWSIFGPSPSYIYGLINAVAVLIIACPCALGLATPMSIMVGVGKGASEGILIKNAKALETMVKVDTLVIDKTGTLTQGKIHVQEMISSDKNQEQKILQLSGSLAALSEHPLSKALAEFAIQKNSSLLKVSDFQSISGKGIAGTIEGNKVVIGNQQLMKDLKVQQKDLELQAKPLQNQGQTVLFVSINNQIDGLFALADSLKDKAKEVIDLLHQEKMKVIVVTGDHALTAQAIGKKLSVDEIISEVLPQDKNKIVKKLQQEGHIVAMAGDGINDAPALAAADVGIAMGTGTDVAIESAEITLIKGDLKGIYRARKLSRATVRNIRQNLAFAFIYNILGVPIAAGLLYPFFGILLSPIFASVAMTFSSVSVIWNALRLRKSQLR